MSASTRIPPIAQPFVSDRAKRVLNLVRCLFTISPGYKFSNTCRGVQVEEFVEKDCIPAEAVFQAQLGEGEKRWQTNPAVLEELKAKARKLGLWNMFLPKNHFSQGAGFSNLEYGLMAEYLGKSKLASEVGDLSRVLAKSDDGGADWWIFRRRITLPLIPVTWRCWPSMAMRRRRSSGLLLCSTARSARLSS